MEAASLQVSAACRDREIKDYFRRNVCERSCRQGCRQLQAGSLCSPECCARLLTDHLSRLTGNQGLGRGGGVGRVLGVGCCLGVGVGGGVGVGVVVGVGVGVAVGVGVGVGPPDGETRT